MEISWGSMLLDRYKVSAILRIPEIQNVSDLVELMAVVCVSTIGQMVTQDLSKELGRVGEGVV